MLLAKKTMPFSVKPISRTAMRCGTPQNRFGEFYYPNGVRVPIRITGEGFYRDRGDQLIRLHRRHDTSSPTGRYYCVIPDASGVDQKIFININISDVE